MSKRDRIVTEPDPDSVVSTSDAGTTAGEHADAPQVETVTFCDGTSALVEWDEPIINKGHGKPPRRRPGARPGSSNALKHGLTSAKVLAQRAQDEHWKLAQAEADAILESLQLQDDPLAIRIARRLAQAEWEAAKLQSYVDNRGRFKKDGSPSRAYEMLHELRRADLAEARRLLDKLQEIVAASGGTGVQEIRVIWGRTVQGVSIDDVDGTAQAPPCAVSTSTADPSPSVACERASEAPNASRDDETGHLDLTGYEAETIEDFLAGAPVASVTFNEMVEDSPADRELRRRFGVGLRWCRLLNRPVGQKDEA